MVDFEEHGHGGRPAAPLDIADAALVLCDARGRVESWPDGAVRLLGHPAADVVGRAAAALLVPDDAARLSGLAAECAGRTAAGAACSPPAARTAPPSTSWCSWPG